MAPILHKTIDKFHHFVKPRKLHSGYTAINQNICNNYKDSRKFSKTTYRLQSSILVVCQKTSTVNEYRIEEYLKHVIW